MEIAILLEKVATAVIIAFPTAYLTSYFSIRKYRTDKWWDKKSQCYCDSINALNEIIAVCDAFIEEKVHGVTLSKEERDSLEKKYKKNMEFCYLQINIGKLLMSDKAHKILQGYEREIYSLENGSDKAVLMESVREVTEGYLEAFIPLAKTDLGASNLLKDILRR